MNVTIKKRRTVFGTALILFLMLLPGLLWAQNQISGQVTNSADQPVSGVSVVIKGSSPQVGTSTDSEGRYTIEASGGKRAPLYFRWL